MSPALSAKSLPPRSGQPPGAGARPSVADPHFDRSDVVDFQVSRALGLVDRRIPALVRALAGSADPAVAA